MERVTSLSCIGAYQPSLGSVLAWYPFCSSLAAYILNVRCSGIPFDPSSIRTVRRIPYSSTVERAWLKVGFDSKCQVDVKYNTLLLFKGHNQDCRAKLSPFLSGDNRALSWLERDT